MESMYFQGCCIDDLLDFNIKDDDYSKPNKRPGNVLSSLNRNGRDFDVPDDDDDSHRPFLVSFFDRHIIFTSLLRILGRERGRVCADSALFCTDSVTVMFVPSRLGTRSFSQRRFCPLKMKLLRDISGI